VEEEFVSPGEFASVVVDCKSSWVWDYETKNWIISGNGNGAKKKTTSESKIKASKNLIKI
jgi:hypothetical protein